MTHVTWQSIVYQELDTDRPPWGQWLLWLTYNWMPSILFPKLGNTCSVLGFLTHTAWFSAPYLWKYIEAASTVGQVLDCFVFRVKLLVFVINILYPEKQTFGKYACNYHLKSCNHRMAYPFMNLFMFYHGKWNLIHKFLSVSSEDVFYHLKSVICGSYW